MWKGAPAGIQAALADHELGTADHGVLAALDDLGPLSQQEIADRLDADKSHVMRLIDQRGLAARTTDPTDRRRHRIELTAAGRRLVRRATPDARKAEDRYFHNSSPAERRTLTDLLQRVLDSTTRRSRDDNAVVIPGAGGCGRSGLIGHVLAERAAAARPEYPAAGIGATPAVHHSRSWPTDDARASAISPAQERH